MPALRPAVRPRHLLAALLGLLPAACTSLAAEPEQLARGRYLVAIGSCNDCHTPGYAQYGAGIPEPARLTGATIGFSGPWGVSYPGNLRLAARDASEDEWLTLARRNGLPPMPWAALQAMSREDLLAIYHYLRALEAAALSEAGAALPPP